MKNKTIKKLAILVSFTTLILNISPVFGQVLEIEVLGGGYKLRGPSVITFSDVASSKSIIPSTLSFADINQTTPSETHNYLEIIDENGGNPFDVTVTAGVLVKNESLTTTTITGSTDTEIKVLSTTGFIAGDNIIIQDGLDETVQTIASISDSQTLVLTQAFSSAPIPGIDVVRVVDCQLNSKKCIPLENFSIANKNSTSGVTAVNGNAADFTLNTQTLTQKPFGGSTASIAGSTGSTLKVVDSSVFEIGDIVTFNDNNVTPNAVTVASIDDTNTITTAETFTTPPGDGIAVASQYSRTLTLGNGNGAQPGDFKIYPVLQINIPAGQMPGTYQTNLSFTII